MAAKRLTDIEIQARICPTSLRWSAADPRTTAWTALFDGVDILRNMMRLLDDACVTLEKDIDLTPDAISRRRTEIGQKAFNELREWPPLQRAERTVTSTINSLEQKMVALPQPPSSVADVALAQELRAHIKAQQRPIDFVSKNMADGRVLSAVLNAPPFLSGLTDSEFGLIRERARASLHPVQSGEQQKLTRALAELIEGVAAARRMTCERCELRVDFDGEARPIRSPLPTSALSEAVAAAKAATAPAA